jgi:hypothetical protein
MVTIRFSSITIKNTANSSSVSSGLNMIINRRDDRKINEGFGAIDGKKNKANFSKHVLFDQDIRDS